MSVEVTTVTTPLQLGEGSHWDDVTQALYFVDIRGCTIYKYVPASDKYTYTKVRKYRKHKFTLELVHFN